MCICVSSAPLEGPQGADERHREDKERHMGQEPLGH